MLEFFHVEKFLSISGANYLGQLFHGVPIINDKNYNSFYFFFQICRKVTFMSTIAKAFMR
jgi:hypothetical protein